MEANAMKVKSLYDKVGRCEFELAFADKNGGIRRITTCYISEKRRLIILGSPHSLIEED